MSITSIPGVSKITAITLICYLPELETLQKKQISSLAGLAHFNRDSGFSKGRRCIQGSRSQVRMDFIYVYSQCTKIILISNLSLLDYIINIKNHIRLLSLLP
ncbi:transposase [Wolbachia endosymbiont of Mansonella ozzardi]|uniref:transposase n=1 Tax=Wolbachia endosymbiont of Mansonella ozzardi TaxID=137464 RepID=UPI001CE0B5DF|nr:transposase [Wolbachia endosymbiont of Mansonella ozzardi]